MSHTRLPAAALVLASLLWSVCAFGQEALEQVVVRNRRFDVKGRLELSLDASAAVLPRLTEHYNFNAGVGLNLTNRWGLELRAGYAVSQHTSLARNVAQDLLRRDPAGSQAEVVVVNDLSGLWEMKGNAVAGVRWSPLYGKVSLVADVPVHFQTYLWLGAGAAMLHRQSVVYCSQVLSRADGTCGSWLTEERVAPLGSAALGFRFFTSHVGALKVELRSYVFPDRYRLDVNRATAETGSATGRLNPSPGLTNLMMFDLGYTFLL